QDADRVPGRTPPGPGPGRVPGADHLGCSRHRRRSERLHHRGRGGLPPERVVPGDHGHRLGVCHPPGLRADDALLPVRPVRRVRAEGASDLGGVRRGRPTGPRRASRTHITSFSSTDPGWFAGLAQQAGATWWNTRGDAWEVSVDDEPTLRVAEFWGELVEEDVVSGRPMYTPEWNAALNDGSLLTWPSAIWAPGVLSGNAEDTAGDWSMAPLPQWEEGERTTGNWGGSATAVATGTSHEEAAA